jgi:hypothetical protein
MADSNVEHKVGCPDERPTGANALRGHWTVLNITRKKEILMESITQKPSRYWPSYHVSNGNYSNNKAKAFKFFLLCFSLDQKHNELAANFYERLALFLAQSNDEVLWAYFHNLRFHTDMALIMAKLL